jgi:hypothetical protein
MYLRPLVVDGDLVIRVGVFAGKERLQCLADIYLEATGLQRNLICGASVWVQWYMPRQVRTVTDAPPSRDALADWGIAAGAIYVLSRRQHQHAIGGKRKEGALTAE